MILVRPLPTANLRTVDPVLVCVTPACDLEIVEFLFGVRADPLQFWDTVNRVHGKGEAIDLIVHGQLHRCVDVALLLVPAYMQILVLASVG